MARHRRQHTTIANLPADLLSNIADHLSQDDVAALRSTCQALRRAVDLAVTDVTFHANVDAAELRSTTNRCTGLHTVKLQQLHPEASVPVLKALAALQHLRSLDLPLFEGMQLEDWTRLSGLTGLTLRGVRESHHGTLAATLPRLTALRSLVLENHGDDQLRAAGLQRLARLSRLTHLDLGRSDGTAAATLALAPQLPALQSLALRLTYPLYRWPPSLGMGLAALGALPGLRQLFLEADMCRSGSHAAVPCAGQASMTRRSCGAFPSSHRWRQGAGCHPTGATAVCRLECVSPLWQNMRSGVPEVRPPFDTLRELRMRRCEMTYDEAIQLAAVAGRLHVLHLKQCQGPLVLAVAAATAVEELSLRGAFGGPRLLEELRPMAGTLKVLNIDSVFMNMDWKDAEALATLTGLTRLAFGCGNRLCGASAAIAQLARMRELSLSCGLDATFDDVELQQLSALGSLTSLQVKGRWENRMLDGSWLPALAAARVPLRQLRLCEGVVRPGCGAEAAIGQLTRLTSLHLSIDRGARSLCFYDPRSELPLPFSPPLQLHLLGCSAQADDAGDATSASRCAASSDGGRFATAGRNTGLQELSLECVMQLSDAELAAAAAGLPDLRRLDISASRHCMEPLRGLRGARLAAFSACRRLRDVSIEYCAELQFRQLAAQLPAQLPALSGLASLHLTRCPRVGRGSVRRLQAAFWAQHKRSLQVVQEQPDEFGEFELPP